MARKPSFLTLDRWIVRRDRGSLAEVADDPEIASHLEAVGYGRTNLEPVPDWVHDLADVAPPRRWPAWASVATAVALAAALLLIVGRSPNSGYVGVKGDLSATVHLADGPWEPTQRPLRRGDVIRLVLHGAPTAYYAVVLESADGMTIVDRGLWPEGGRVSGAWAFDETPADATLVVLALQTDPGGLNVEEMKAQARDAHRIPLDSSQ